jgi:hypothetical protein
VATSAITNALIAVLDGDAVLGNLAPDGVWFGAAPPHCDRFILVSLAHNAAIPMFNGRAYEEKYYVVKAVMRKDVGVDLAVAQSAASRIETILDGARLLASGYEPMACSFEESVELDPDVDAADDSVRWFHQGGIYKVSMSCV